jgi:prepilin-type N-terminal cleavage/methylation domain-containing protein
MSSRPAVGRPDSDRGTTLVELMVTLVVMTIAAGIIGSVLVSAQNATTRMQHSASAIDDARLISATIDRELRSASCIAAPAENLTGNTLTFRTVLYGKSLLVTYVVGNGVVTRADDDVVGPARTVIQSAGATSSAFKQLTTPLRAIEVDIPIRSGNGGEFRLRTTIAGRNAWRTC